MAKLPSFQFYPGDWMKDSSLRVCSLAARGLWLDMLCLMFDCVRRGYLHVGDMPMSLEQLARATGCSTEEASRHLRELETAGVLSKSEHGMIYSRRLVREEERRNKTRERVKNHRSRCNAEVTPRVRRCNTHSSSSSSTSVKEKEEKEKPPSPSAIPKPLDTAQFRCAWGSWEEHRRQKRSPLTANTIRLQLRKCERMGVVRAVAMIEYSIEQGWTGLYEPDSGSRRNDTSQARLRNGPGKYGGRGRVVESKAPAP